MTTRPSAPVDDIDNIRRFVAAIGLDRVSSQSSGSTLQAEQRCAEMTSNESTMQGEQHSSTETTALASPNNDNSNDQSSSTLASTPLTRSRANSGSPSHYLTASPQIGGLLAPQNTPQTIPASPDIHAPRTNKTPKTGPTSPDLNAPCTNNEDVSEALYDYFTNLQGMKPLSESIWAPKNIQATRQRSLLNGPRMPPRTPAPNMTAVSVVQPNPDINDTFTRLSFKAADHDYKADAFGDRVESSSSSSKIASQGNRFDILATSESSDKNDVSSPSASAGKENRSLSTPVAEENVTSSITKPSYLPPHLRVKEIASNLSRTDSVTEKKPKETENSDSAPAVKQAQGHKPILPSSFLGRWGATKKHVEDTLTADTAFGTGKDVSETAVGNEKRRSDATVGMDKGPTTVTSVNKSPVPTEVIEDASLSDLKLTGKSSNTSREHAPARPIKAAVEQGKAPESLEKKLFFSAWPQSEARERGRKLPLPSLISASNQNPLTLFQPPRSAKYSLSRSPLTQPPPLSLLSSTAAPLSRSTSAKDQRRSVSYTPPIASSSTTRLPMAWSTAKISRVARKLCLWS